MAQLCKMPAILVILVEANALLAVSLQRVEAQCCDRLVAAAIECGLTGSRS